MYIYKKLRTAWLNVGNFSMATFALLLMVSCANIYDKQANIYDDYRAKLDTATSCNSLKGVNDALEQEIVFLLRRNSQEVVAAAKEGKKYRDSEKALAKAETEYVNAYLGKIVPMIIKEQNDKYADAVQKMETLSTYDELAALNRSLNGSVADIAKKYADEFKKVMAKNIFAEQRAALEKTKNNYMAVYASKIAPLLYTKEKSIYDSYMLKLGAAAGYERLKEISQFCKSEIAIFNNDNAEVLQKMSANDYSEQKAAVAVAKAEFEQRYMEKVALVLLDYQKELYTGTLEVFADIKNADELDKVNRAFIDVSNIIAQDNSEELKWIVAAADKGNKAYKSALDEVKYYYDKVVDASDDKAAELGLR